MRKYKSMSKPITLDEATQLLNLSFLIDNAYSLEEWEYFDEIKSEQSAETAYERELDYRAWLRDGWQPAHAF